MSMNDKTKIIRANQLELNEFLKRYDQKSKEENGGVYLSKTERNNVVTMISIYRIYKMTEENIKFILSKFVVGGTYPRLNEDMIKIIVKDARETRFIE